MPIDPQIPLSVKPPAPSTIGTLADVRQESIQRRDALAAAATTQKMSLDAEKAERERQSALEDQEITEIFKKHGGDWEKASEEVKTIYPLKWLPIDKDVREQYASRLKASIDEAEAFQKVTKSAYEQLAVVTDEVSLQQAKLLLKLNGKRLPPSLQADYQTIIDSIPSTYGDGKALEPFRAASEHVLARATANLAGIKALADGDMHAAMQASVGGDIDQAEYTHQWQLAKNIMTSGAAKVAFEAYPTPDQWNEHTKNDVMLIGRTAKALEAEETARINANAAMISAKTREAAEARLSAPGTKPVDETSRRSAETGLRADLRDFAKDSAAAAEAERNDDTVRPSLPVGGYTQKQLRDLSEIRRDPSKQTREVSWSETAKKWAKRTKQPVSAFRPALATGDDEVRAPLSDAELVWVRKYEGAMESYDAMLGGSGRAAASAPAGLAPATPADASKVVAGYDFTTYAADPDYGTKLTNVMTELPPEVDAKNLEAVIRAKFPASPLTGAMVVAAAETAGLDPQVFAGVLQLESRYASDPLARKTNNPGNVGNTGTATRTFPTLEEGLAAAAAEVVRRKVPEVVAAPVAPVAPPEPPPAAPPPTPPLPSGLRPTTGPPPPSARPGFQSPIGGESAGSGFGIPQMASPRPPAPAAAPVAPPQAAAAAPPQAAAAVAPPQPPQSRSGLVPMPQGQPAPKPIAAAFADAEPGQFLVTWPAAWIKQPDGTVQSWQPPLSVVQRLLDTNLGTLERLVKSDLYKSGDAKTRELEKQLAPFVKGLTMWARYLQGLTQPAAGAPQR